LPGTRTRPPRHLADLDPPARRAAVAELGGEPFRGDQLARHYFARLTDDPDEMTDLPAASRAELAAAIDSDRAGDHEQVPLVERSAGRRADGHGRSTRAGRSTPK